MTIGFIVWPCILLGGICCAAALHNRGRTRGETQLAVAAGLLHAAAAAASLVLLALYWALAR